ncbi:MAG: hypothetical protein PW788_14260 [Micavibrio sp.]|nr:hypothetical protein [Micavibrio sp.]
MKARPSVMIFYFACRIVPSTVIFRFMTWVVKKNVRFIGGFFVFVLMLQCLNQAYKHQEKTMKKFFALIAMLVVLSVPAFAQSDKTSALLQGLQSLGGSGSSTSKTPSTLDQIKTTVLMKASLSAIDTNHNGTVSKEELATLTNKLFDYADKDHNGQLTEEELSTFAEQMNKVMSFLR